MKLTGIEVQLCIHALNTLAQDCEKIANEGFDPIRPELTKPFAESAKRYRALADKLDSTHKVST